jgi:putative tryptophan/tyrosine transport system substrate-binding protein
VRRRDFLPIFGSAVVLPTTLRPEQRAGVYAAQEIKRIGFVEAGSKEANQGFLTAFTDELSRLGWIQGKNLVIFDRWAEARGDRLPDIINELISADVDLLVTAAGPATIAAKAATRTIPIVLVGVADPVAYGIVRSLSRPGANITGLSAMSLELTGKQLQLLKEMVPGMMRVAAIANPDDPDAQQRMQDVYSSAERLGVAVLVLEATTPAAIESAFAHLRDERCESLWISASPLTFANRARIVALAAAAHLPAIYPFRGFAVEGGLMSFGTDYTDLFRRAAVFVDKILRGAKPGDLPVELPTKFELVLNLKTAKALNITIPPVLLIQANEVIE